MVQVIKVQTQLTTDLLPPPLPRRGTILVVEDFDDLRVGLAQLLELHGFTVRAAANGEQALRHLEEAPDTFALILLDLILPGRLSGRDLRARQLADATTALVPIVVVSACEPEEISRTQLRPAAWLEKPFQIDALLDVVKRHVVPECEPDVFPSS
jgi:two-component system cell cycle sensor histidine kinase/response regulator CckA